MTRIADLLALDDSEPIEEGVEFAGHRPDARFADLAGYVVTDRIKQEYERLFGAMRAALTSPDERAGIWISGPIGSGKSSFVRNIERALGAGEVLGAPIPYVIFPVSLRAELLVETHGEHIAGAMYRALLRELDYAEDYDISELEIDLEKEGQLSRFQDLCRAQYQKEWHDIRKTSHRLACASSLLYRLAPQTYPAGDAWLHAIQARPSRRPGVQDLVEKAFELCEVRRPGKAFAFIVDEIGPFGTLGPHRIENLRAVVEEFGRESLRRLKAGKISGPTWIVVTAREKLEEVSNHLAASRVTSAKLLDRFTHQIDLDPGDVREAVSCRVLGKKESQEPALRKLFRDRGVRLLQNVALEKCSLQTHFDEDQFVRFYPYLPHLIDLTMEILAGIRLHPNRPRPSGGANPSIMQHCSDMLLSGRTRLADQPPGALVSIDKIYALLEAYIPAEKRKEIREVRRRFDKRMDYPGLAGRVAEAICLMEFVQTALPRTTQNIAALLIQNVSEEPPTSAVGKILQELQQAQFVRQTESGWKLYDFDELLRHTAALKDLRSTVGVINPRLPGWRNDLIQSAKKMLARFLSWYTGPLYEFDAAVSLSLEEVVRAVDHLTTSLEAIDRVAIRQAFDLLSVDMVEVEKRLDQLDQPNAPGTESMRAHVALLHRQVKVLVNLEKTVKMKESADWIEASQGIGNPKKYRVSIDQRFDERHADTQWPRIECNDKTTYIIGLFGSGRRYINDLILQNMGERAKYFRDGIRLHPGPTPMIYSGHVTMKYLSRSQEAPTVMRYILEAVKSGYANLIFVYRHPLDSLLTNWIWWRTFLRDGRAISGISQVYKNPDELGDALEDNFSEFESFAAGDPNFFAASPGPRFLSFREFVEETELHLQSAQLALRLEDFMIDPLREFSKVVELMSVDLDLSCLTLVSPRTKPYGYLAIQEQVPRFRDFIDGLDAETKRRIENLAYEVDR
jgi:hypothetical protein